MKIFLIFIGVCLAAGIGFMLFLMASFYFASPAGKPVDKEKPFGYFWGKFKKNKIYYASSAGSFTGGSELVGVDIDSFEQITYEYARDKDRIFHKQYPLDVDRQTFHVDNNVPKDAKHVYWIDLSRDAERTAVVIEGADPASYHEIDGRSYWAKDRAHYFFNGKRVDEIDYDSFSFLSYAWGKDKARLYQLTDDRFNIIDVNIGDVVLIEPSVVRDDKHVYVSAYMHGDGDPDTLQLNAFDYQPGSDIEILSDIHIRHHGKIYYYGLPTEIDATSFHPFLDADQRALMGFSKDKHSVYLYNTKLPHIDVATFTYDNYDFRDKDNHYDRNGQVITPLNENL